MPLPCQCVPLDVRFSDCVFRAALSLHFCFGRLKKTQQDFAMFGLTLGSHDCLNCVCLFGWLFWFFLIHAAISILLESEQPELFMSFQIFPAQLIKFLTTEKACFCQKC